MAIYEFEGHRPQIEPSAFIHPEAVVIGRVFLSANCYVGAGAVLRGDWGDIIIGEGSNIQENCVLHVRLDEAVTAGPSSHIGHGAILHTCTLGYHVLVGMGAILCDGVGVGDESVIGAGTLIPEGRQIPPGKLVVGVPGRIKGDVTPELKAHAQWGTSIYQALPPRCHKSLRLID